jgi:hypothetical protein
MWEPRRLTTLCGFTACYRASFTLYRFEISARRRSNRRGFWFSSVPPGKCWDIARETLIASFYLFSNLSSINSSSIRRSVNQNIENVPELIKNTNRDTGNDSVSLYDQVARPSGSRTHVSSLEATNWHLPSVLDLSLPPVPFCFYHLWVFVLSFTAHPVSRLYTVEC